MLLPIVEAFTKFRSNLEPTASERQDASRRQQDIRAQVADRIFVADSFLTGSYIRHTAVRPLRDVDVMVVLAGVERGYLEGPPGTLLDKVADVLEPHYPSRVSTQARSVTVEFGVQIVNDVSDKVVSVEVVPAFTEGEHYRIPDSRLGYWMSTDPKQHKTTATTCDERLAGNWVPLVKMIKKANSYAGEQRTTGKPVTPSFLLEVMAYKLIAPPWTGPDPLELRAFFASAADLINQPWPDPAGLGPDVSGRLHDSPTKLSAATEWLHEATATFDLALRHARNNKIDAALDVWQGLFGPLFVKSRSA